MKNIIDKREQNLTIETFQKNFFFQIMGGNNMSKNVVQCTLTTPERKKIDSIKYAEVLRPNLIKTSTRKKIIHREVQMNLLTYEDYFVRRKTGH